jgi:hypothetical protein
MGRTVVQKTSSQIPIKTPAIVNSPIRLCQFICKLAFIPSQAGIRGLVWNRETTRIWPKESPPCVSQCLCG